jgi:hypothetical protein
MLQLSLLENPRHIIPISGKDSLACGIVQTTRQPDIKYEFLFNDTGSEYPETYEWLNRVEQTMGWKIHRTDQNLLARIQSFNGFLPSHQQRWCTRDCKIEPMDKWLAGSPTYAVIGIRGDENRPGFIPTSKNNLVPIYPLKELGVSLPMVWAIVAAKNLLPPAFHWQRLEDAVLNVLPESRWFRSLKDWERCLLFSGRTRSNCFHCFYQRLYEWLWCYEVHPNLFAKAASYEKSDYTWNKDHPLSDWDNSAFRNKIFDRRVKEVLSILQGFSKESDSELSATSCGLVCGK